MTRALLFATLAAALAAALAALLLPRGLAAPLAPPPLDPPSAQLVLHARESLRAVQPGERLTIGVRTKTPIGAGPAAEAAARSWSLVVAPCAALTAADVVPRLSHAHAADADGLFRLTVPAARAPDDPYICIARWHDGRVSDDPMPLRFCLGDLALRDCHPEWYAIRCAGVSEAECLLRATIDGKRSGNDPSGRLLVIADGIASPVTGIVRAGCPVHAPPWGVVFTHDGRLMRLDLARRAAETVREPPDGMRWSSPWPEDNGALVVAVSADGRRELVRLDHAGAITTLRSLPPGAGRIVGRAGDVVLMSHRLSPHAVRVPLDAMRPAVQLDVAAPVGDCAVEVDGMRVENDGIERAR